jgi:DNA invertase Pin-like site-specific DNA recombinase
MALIGLLRVTNNARDVAHQRATLDLVCSRVFEEETSRRRLVKNRPGLLDALDHLRPGDLLVVTEAKHLGRSTIDGLDVLHELRERGVTVKVLEGMAAGEHSRPSWIVDNGRSIADAERAFLSRKIKTGLRVARVCGSIGGRPTVLDDDKRTQILIRREQGNSIRAIAHSIGVSVGTVHNVLSQKSRIRRAPTPSDDRTVVVQHGLAPSPVDSSRL